MAPRYNLAVHVLLIILMTEVSSSQDVPSALSKVIQSSNQMLTDMRAMKTNIDQKDGLRKFISTVDSLHSDVKNFMEISMTGVDGNYEAAVLNTMNIYSKPYTRQSLDILRKVLQSDEEKPFVVDKKAIKNNLEPLYSNFKNTVMRSPDHKRQQEEFTNQHMPPSVIADDVLFYSYTLKENHNSRMANLARMLSGQVATGQLSLYPICQEAGDAMATLNEMSITNICGDINSCSGKRLFTSKNPNKEVGEPVQTPQVLKKYINYTPEQIRNSAFLQYYIEQLYNHEDVKKFMNDKLRQIKQRIWELLYAEQDTSETCTVDKQCNVAKALPMMTGLVWYQVNEMIFQKLCPSKCQGGQCSSGTTQNVIDNVERLKLFASSLPSIMKDTWYPYFIKSLSSQTFTNLDSALSAIKEKESDFQVSEKQCSLIKFSIGCQRGATMQQYRVLRKIQQRNSNGERKVKDIRRYSQMSFTQMIMLQKDNLQHIELLGNIKKLDDNLQASVSGISRYFEGLAKFDEGIANTDVGFIKGELEKYEASLKTVESKLTKDINFGMKLMAGILAANLYEEVGKLATSIATNSNPLKLIFSGPDVVDVMDRAGAVANAASDLVKGTALIISIQDLYRDSLNLGKAFGGNAKQLKSMKTVVEKIKQGKGNDIGEDADKYLEEYGAYTPSMDRSTLAKNDALWSAFKDAMCDVLGGDVGVAGSVPKAIAGGKLICERLDGTLAQFFTLREDIFDFQFQLVDSLAAVVRGNIAQRFAQDIKGRYDTLDASQFLTGFLMMQSKIQKVCSVFCDILEYKNLGKAVSDCATVNGLYRKQNIDNLSARKTDIPHEEVTREVYLPTLSETKGDTSVVDLQALARGETVVFKVPSDRDWLIRHGWILPYEETIPFIKSIKVFLPKNVFRPKVRTTTTVVLKSVSGSSVSANSPNTATVYLLPKQLNKYRTIYEEGYSNCYTEIENPYSLCNNLPKICDKTRRMVGNNLLPTVLSTWSMKVMISEGANMVNYTAPNHDTNLFLKAKAVLMVPLYARKKSVVKETIPSQSDVVESQDGCCQENRYRISLDNYKCYSCPKGSTAKFGGLYCQPPQITIEKALEQAQKQAPKPTPSPTPAPTPAPTSKPQPAPNPPAIVPNYQPPPNNPYGNFGWGGWVGRKR